MANQLKNACSLLSPKLLSSLSPGRTLTLRNSEGRRHLSPLINHQPLFKPRAAKQLDFTPKANKQPLSQIPSLKIHVVEDEFNIEKHCELNINTPNKKELTQNGLDKFKPNLNILGKGTFGTVFKGKYQGELVAIKITSNSSKERNVLHLKHPNIVCTRDVIHSPNSKYDLVIMEFLPRSKTLQDTLYSLKKLPENLTEKKILLKGFAEGVSLGLDYLHSKGLLHLDLKPCNVLVTEESVCKICDFGNSTTIAECLQAYDCIGTPIYTAPELLLGGRPSTKSDVYSLGLIFWQIKHQQIPFAEYERVETVIYNVAKHGIRPCYSGNTEDELFKLISRCWHSDPGSRPKTADILECLKSVEF